MVCWLTITTTTVSTAFAPPSVSRSTSTASTRRSSYKQTSILFAPKQVSDVTTTTSTSSSTTTSKYSSTALFATAVDRMSRDCLSAIKHGTSLGNELGCQELTKELLLAGIAMHPERARKTMDSYDIKSKEVQRAALETVQTSRQPLASGGNRQSRLPFNAETKMILNKANNIAEEMQTEITRSEHVLLALLGYNYGDKIQSSPVLNVLKNIRGLTNNMAGPKPGKRKFSVFQFCEDLVNDLPELALAANRSDVILIGGIGATKINTLREVSVDMTQEALDGKYDAVYGRNDEIRSILRTLGRRRKNNPCLIG